MNALSLSAIPLAVGLVVSTGIFLLGGLPLKYTVAVTLASPIVLTFALTKEKQKFLLVAILLALPFTRMTFFLGPPPNVFHAGGAQSVPQFNLVDLLLLVAILHDFFNGNGKWRNCSRLYFLCAVSIIGFLTWCGLSIVLSDYKLLGLTSLLDLSKVSLLWFYLVSRITREEDIDLVVTCLLCGLALQGAIGIYQAFYGFPEWASSIAKGDPTTLETLDTRSFLRVGGTIGWTTVFAQYLCLLIPLSLVKLVSSSAWRSTLGCSICVILSMTSLVFTLSRSGWVSLAIGLAVTGILLYRHSSKEIRGRLRLASSGVLILFLLFFPIMKERISSDDSGSSMARLPMMRVAWSIIQENPIFGAGLNTYSEIMHRYDTEHLISGFEYPVHNLYLFIAAETGVPGLLFFLLFVISIVIGLLKMPGKATDYISGISIGLLGGMVANMSHGFVEQGIKADIQLWYVFSAVCGIAAAIPRLEGISRIITVQQKTPSA
jgi:putative inorganic carbon (hco3(-)) transporter